MSCRRPSLSEPACAWTSHGFYLYGFPSPMGIAGERYPIKPPLGAALLIVPRVYLLKSFQQGDNSAIRVFPLLFELPKAIEHHQPVYQSYRWQLGPNMWSSPTTKSVDLYVVTALQEPSQGITSDPPQVDLPAIVQCQWRGQRGRPLLKSTFSHMLIFACNGVGVKTIRMKTYGTPCIYSNTQLSATPSRADSP